MSLVIFVAWSIKLPLVGLLLTYETMLHVHIIACCTVHVTRVFSNKHVFLACSGETHTDCYIMMSGKYINPIHPVENSLKKQKPCTKV